jgi:hypothetical protein
MKYVVTAKSQMNVFCITECWSARSDEWHVTQSCRLTFLRNILTCKMPGYEAQLLLKQFC